MVAAALRTPQPGAVVTYWPRGASRDLFYRHEPEVLIAGPAGTGKTYGALWRLHLAALKYPGMRAIMLRQVQEDLTASVLVTYQTRVLGSGNFGVRAFGGSKLKPAGFQYPNGSELLIGGLDKPEKVMSREYDLVYINEATEVSEEAWENLTTRCRWGAMPYQQVFGDCNPQGPGHWLYKRVQSGRTVMLASVHEDNPALFDPKTNDWTEAGRAYIARLDALTGFRRDRLRLGLWTAAEGVVYPGFTRATHVRAVDTTGWRHALAVDVGTRNPTAILTLAFGSDRLHVPHEVYERGYSASQIVDATIDRYQATDAEFVVVDPSAAGLIADLAAAGLTVRKAQNDVKVGIARVTDALPTLTVDPACTGLIEEFETYSYNPRALANDVPVKAHDHALDSLRYGILEIEADTGPALPALGIGQVSRWR